LEGQNVVLAVDLFIIMEYQFAFLLDRLPLALRQSMGLPLLLITSS
jgi:hypothetical protein